MSSWTLWHQHGSPIVCDTLAEAVAHVEAMLPGHQCIPAGDRLFCYPENERDWFHRTAVIQFSPADRIETVEHVRAMRAEELAAKQAAMMLAAGGLHPRPIVDRFDLAAD